MSNYLHTETQVEETVRGFHEPTIPSTELIVEALVSRAHAAQQHIDEWSESRIDMLLRRLRDVIAEHAHALAAAAVAETGMGNVHDKTVKNSVASAGVYAQLAAATALGEIGFDRERHVAEIASPVGVIVGLIPATHPVATFIFKVLIAIKGRNAIILSPSRRARAVSEHVGGLIQQALGKAGAPTDLVQWLGGDSNRHTTAALMSHRGVGLILATGGQAMVRAAYASGTPAIGVGPGNAPALISADADLRHAARSIVQSKSFDNGLICGAENHLVVDSSAHAPLVAHLVLEGAALLTEEESARFRAAVVNPRTNRVIRPLVGQDAETLATLAHITRPYGIRLLVVPAATIAAGDYLAGEKLVPVVSLFTVADARQGIRACRALLDIEGKGHTAIIHTRNAELVRRFATSLPVSRILVNSPATQGLMGLTTGLVPSLSLGCGSWGGTSTTNSITYKDLLNIKRVAYDKWEQE
jgi:acyl-CoA reductase-like NAD-dependent aldehyde dehydrogenase